MAELNVMTTREVSEFTGLAPRTIRRWAEEGRLVPVKAADNSGWSTSHRFAKADVERVLAERAKLPAYRRQIRRKLHG